MFVLFIYICMYVCMCELYLYDGRNKFISFYNINNTHVVLKIRVSEF